MRLLLKALRRILRHSLRVLDTHLDRSSLDHQALPDPNGEAGARYRQFLLALDLPNEESRQYLRHHMDRIVTTLLLAPPPRSNSQALELGCYMQMAPALIELAGYKAVRGSYLGNGGVPQVRTASAGGKLICRCEIDLFNAEKDRFPYDDGSFELILACEVIEHLREDPMHMLLECRRVLAKDGVLLLTTPNCASLTSIARVLLGTHNPYLFSAYPSHTQSDEAAKHIREYTAFELTEAIRAAGFRIGQLSSQRVKGFGESAWVKEILVRHNFPAALRGEQLYCIAIKDESAHRVRWPKFLYAD